MKLSDFKQVTNKKQEDMRELWYDCDFELDGDEILRCPWAAAESMVDIATSGAPDNIRFALERIRKSDHPVAKLAQAVIIEWNPHYPEVVAKMVWFCCDPTPTPDSEFQVIWTAIWDKTGTKNGGIFR